MVVNSGHRRKFRARKSTLRTLAVFTSKLVAVKLLGLRPQRLAQFRDRLVQVVCKLLDVHPPASAKLICVQSVCRTVLLGQLFFLHLFFVVVIFLIFNWSIMIFINLDATFLVHDFVD